MIGINIDATCDVLCGNMMVVTTPWKPNKIITNK